MNPTDRTPPPAANLIVEGPAYPPLVKLIATGLVLVLALGGLRADAAVWASLDLTGWLVLLLVLVIVASGWWTILTSRTRMDERGIERLGLFSRRIELQDLTQAKLVFVPGLAWIVVPRLVLRARGLGVATFTAGDAGLLAAMQGLILQRTGLTAGKAAS